MFPCGAVLDRLLLERTGRAPGAGRTRSRRIHSPPPLTPPRACCCFLAPKRLSASQVSRGVGAKTAAEPETRTRRRRERERTGRGPPAPPGLVQIAGPSCPRDRPPLLLAPKPNGLASSTEYILLCLVWLVHLHPQSRIPDRVEDAPGTDPTAADTVLGRDATWPVPTSPSTGARAAVVYATA